MNLPIKSVVFGDENYPLLLREIPVPPQKLFYIGELPAPDEKMIAIVGTRKLTSEGKVIAKQIAKDLAENGITIVSGLCLATVVVEMPKHSGASVTAKNALEQGREVFMVPGPVRHANYEGSHLLIRNGARLVTSAQDILEDLNLAYRTGKAQEDYADNGGPESSRCRQKPPKNPLRLTTSRKSLILNLIS